MSSRWGSTSIASLKDRDLRGRAARRAWDRALPGRATRLSQRAVDVSSRPTGTIGLFMDCDTTGVEPDFALVKFKKLAGGGYFKIANQSLPPALGALWATPPSRSKRSSTYAMGTLTRGSAVPQPCRH